MEESTLFIEREIQKSYALSNFFLTVILLRFPSITKQKLSQLHSFLFR
jgi:hypothetical protein